MGFCRLVSIEDAPEGRQASLTEFGLPLRGRRRDHSAPGAFSASAWRAPTHVLFNGGVLRAKLVRDRIMEMLNGWFPRR